MTKHTASQAATHAARTSGVHLSPRPCSRTKKRALPKTGKSSGVTLKSTCRVARACRSATTFSTRCSDPIARPTDSKTRRPCARSPAFCSRFGSSRKLKSLSMSGFSAKIRRKKRAPNPSMSCWTTSQDSATGEMLTTWTTGCSIEDTRLSCRSVSLKRSEPKRRGLPIFRLVSRFGLFPHSSSSSWIMSKEAFARDPTLVVREKTLFLRGRGNSSSSKSLFTPADFSAGVDSDTPGDVAAGADSDGDLAVGADSETPVDLATAADSDTPGDLAVGVDSDGGFAVGVESEERTRSK
mmetsp:Transcript_31668/g.75257  ORF Transcript_31668/g.75257 Transcript_31668/m.75257 type:complete len:296 (+) Transcript_31668:345-1232(+)